MKIAALIPIFVSLTGCAALIPNTVTPELVHESHITQHAPIAAHPTDYGANIAEVALGWRVGHVSLSLAEGVDLDRGYPNSCGEIMGPREEFTARIGYVFQVKKE